MNFFTGRDRRRYWGVRKKCHEAFTEIDEKHSFRTDFPNMAVAEGLLTFMVVQPGCYVVVAERACESVGSNFLDERARFTASDPFRSRVFSGSDHGMLLRTLANRPGNDQHRALKRGFRGGKSKLAVVHLFIALSSLIAHLGRKIEY